MNRSLSAEEYMKLIIHFTDSLFPLFILPLATIGNILCFLVFCRKKFQKRLTRTSSLCIRVLCLNDLILLYLFLIDVFIKNYTKSNSRIYSTPLQCRIYKCVRYSVLDFSAYLQLGLTTDRFICCVHHQYYSRWRKRNYLFYLLLSAIVFIFIKNSSFLSTAYGYYSTNHNDSKIVKCSAKIDERQFARYMAYGQSLIDILFITCLPFFLILYFNSRILKEGLHLRTKCWTSITQLIYIAKGRKSNTINATTCRTTLTSDSNLTNLLRGGHRARHRRFHLTFALGCISFVFILSTAPYKIFKIIDRHDKLQRDQNMNGAPKSIQIRLGEVINECFVYISCSTPFFVCFATSSMFRDELRRLFQQ